MRNRVTKAQKAKYIKIAKHYAYAAFTAAAALYATGTTDWKALANAALIGALGPIIGAANPNVKEYGKTNNSSD